MWRVFYFEYTSWWFLQRFKHSRHREQRDPREVQAEDRQLRLHSPRGDDPNARRSEAKDHNPRTKGCAEPADGPHAHTLQRLDAHAPI